MTTGARAVVLIAVLQCFLVNRSTVKEIGEALTEDGTRDARVQFAAADDLVERIYIGGMTPRESSGTGRDLLQPNRQGRRFQPRGVGKHFIANFLSRFPKLPKSHPRVVIAAPLPGE